MAKPYYTRAQIKSRYKDYEGARKDFEKALGLAPESKLAIEMELEKMNFQ